MTHINHLVRVGLVVLLAAITPLITASSAGAAPFAAFVMDARTGKKLHSQNADTKLHPASLTKMMTLYMAFTAIERGQVRLDSRFLVSTNASKEPPSRLGLRAGQRIQLRYLIRAAAVKSANDAATAIGEGLAGSESGFAQQMTAMARALGMRNTRFLNANGLTQSGHYSTARDMTLLGRRLFYDFPQYYSIFSRRSADAGIATVRSTNRNFLNNYPGADGIKTGYTRAAGFNLTASAHRGSKRIIATVMGGKSSAQRNAIMAQLLDAGFGRAPKRVREIRPDPPAYVALRKTSRKVQGTQKASAPKVDAPKRVAVAAKTTASTAAKGSAQRKLVSGKTLSLALKAATAPASKPRRSAAQVSSSKQSAAQAAPTVPHQKGLRLAASSRPQARPKRATVATAKPETATAASLAGKLIATSSRPDPAPRSRASVGAPSGAVPVLVAGHLDSSRRPTRRPEQGSDSGEPLMPVTAKAKQTALTLSVSAAPPQRSNAVFLGRREPSDAEEATRVVSRVSSSGGGHWGVTLGYYETKKRANELLVKTAIQESNVLEGALRRVGHSKRGWEANFVGMSRSTAELACERLAARQQRCRVLTP